MPDSSAPKVFISYSHDSPEHRERVLRLADRLRDDGVDAWLDRYEVAPAEGWARWMRDRIGWADVVVLVCTETYQRRFYGREEPGTGRGVTWEGLILTAALYDAHGRTGSMVPVVFDAAASGFVPDVLATHTRHVLPGAYDALCRHLWGEPDAVAPPLGARRAPPLPRHAAAWAADPTRGIPRRLPDRNPRFVGRGTELDLLHARLGQTGAVGVTQQVAAWGQGGVGKTALAVEYAWAHLGDYPGGAFHLRAEAPVPEAEVAELAGALAVEPGPSSRETAEAVRRRLETGGAALILLDNLDDPARYRAWKEVLPGGPVRRLVTTRKPSVPGVAMLPIERLDAAAGAALLARYRADAGESPDAVASIVAWCDGLAVLVALVGAYLARHPSIAWAAYAKSLKQKGLATVRRTDTGELLPDYERRVDEVLDDTLKGLSAPEVRALEYAALLAADVVPRPWLAALLAADADVEVDPLPGQEDDACGGVVDGLQELGLLRVEEEPVLALHRVLRLRLRERLEGRREALVDRVVALAEERGEASHAALLDQTTRWELGPLLRLSEELEGQGRRVAAASLAIWVSAPLKELGRYVEAAASLDRFVDAEGHTLGPADAEEGATLLSNLAAALKELGDLDGARRRMDQAISIDEAALPAGHPTLAIQYSNLAVVLKDLGDLDGARHRMEQAITIEEAALPVGHPNLAIRYSNLAMVLADLGDLAGARRRMEQAITIDEAALPAGHPSLAIRYSNLATVLRDLGDLDSARNLLTRALRIARAALPPEHPNVRRFANILRTIGGDPDAP